MWNSIFPPSNFETNYRYENSSKVCLTWKQKKNSFVNKKLDTRYWIVDDEGHVWNTLQFERFKK